MKKYSQMLNISYEPAFLAQRQNYYLSCRIFYFFLGLKLEAVEAEPQSLVFAPKYTWINCQISLQCICSEVICTVGSDYSWDGDVKPGGNIGAFR